MILREVQIMFEARPGGDITYPLDSPEEIEKAKQKSYTLKEGCHHKTKVRFRVKDEIISGLKIEILHYRKGIRVVRDQQMLGSFAPQSEPHEVTLPVSHGWEEAPSGLLSRGSYTLTYKFVDDDGAVQAELDMAFDIKSDW
ncbi:hypothetical protein OIDMADRAFT_136160 [Oidiodendron maius Zn]|uniref:Rho GDP-dissociation inhibitor n=1 Tax=Oidiodendron maius (strain Zn) TaxID=913774 RepID=A0A0C3GVX1_OIDMZ|nr:hypothetical protein OIDMADRAFT_136160 [Oidiodendron maius Zn]